MGSRLAISKEGEGRKSWKLPSKVQADLGLQCPHSMMRTDNIWQCSASLSFCWTRQGLRSKSRQECQGVNKNLRAIILNSNQHSWVVGDMGGNTILVCLRCGYWMRRRAFGLSTKCTGKATLAGEKVLRNLRQGKQPDGSSHFQQLWRLSTSGLKLITVR